MVLYMTCLLLALYIFVCANSKPGLFVNNQTVVCPMYTSNTTVILQSVIFVMF